MQQTDRRYENRIRKLATRRGYRVQKSRQQEHFNNQGQFMLVCYRKGVVLGDRYDASLERIEDYLKDHMDR